MSSQQNTRKLHFNNIVCCINRDKRNEKGDPTISMSGFKKDRLLGHNSRNEVLQIYIATIENGAETDLQKIVIAPHEIGVDRFFTRKEEWESTCSNTFGVEVH